MKSVAIAFYNTENFFDTIDNPKTFDDDFTPEGAKKWTKKRYENKVLKPAGSLFFDAARRNTADNVFRAETEHNQDRYDRDCHRQINSALISLNVRRCF